IGFRPRSRAWSWKTTEENMLPCSVTASAGIFSFTASSSSSSTRQAPWTSENSVCRCRWTNSFTGLFPLDRGRWLRRDVVDDAVDAAHLVDNARRDRRQEIMRQGRPIGGHPVETLHRANRHGVFVRPRVTHDADALHRQQHRKALPQPLIPASFPNLIGDNAIGEAQQIQPLLRHGADQTDGEPGTREGLPDDELAFESEILPDSPDLVLEEIAQRLDERELHAFGETANVVVTLDDDGRTMHGCGLDHVRIQRALSEESEVTELIRAFFEHVNECSPDD